MFAIVFVLVLVIGYLLGSINTALIVGKAKGMDIREHGSGNAGLTNTYRVLGAKAGFFVIFGDILKGFIAARIGQYLLGPMTTVPSLGILVGGLGAILGHNFPLYFKFKGGKGVLVTGTIIALTNMKLAILLFSMFIAIVIVSRYVSLASLACAFLLPIGAYVLEASKDNMYFFVWSVIVSLLILIMHRKNVKRLRDGEESRFTLSRRKRRRRI